VAAEQALADIARPLAERGERDVRRIGERLRRHQRPPDLILASPSARTLHTAQLVATIFELPQSSVAVDARLYLAVPGTLMEVIAAQDASIERLLVVGHNPGLSELVHELLPAFDVDDLPTSAVATLEYAAAAGWTQIVGTPARLRYYDFPKNAGAPATAR
jgi:phosphohistidine phosphatase